MAGQMAGIIVNFDSNALPAVFQKKIRETAVLIDVIKRYCE